jgi:hypothetical protein
VLTTDIVLGDVVERKMERKTKNARGGIQTEKILSKKIETKKIQRKKIKRCGAAGGEGRERRTVH